MKNDKEKKIRTGEADRDCCCQDVFDACGCFVGTTCCSKSEPFGCYFYPSC